MRYIAILDDNFISNFRRDDADGLTLVMKDQSNCTRATRLKPVQRFLLVFPDGQSVYLTQEHIDALMKFENDRITREVLDEFMTGFKKTINEGKIVPDTLQGWRYEEGEE